MLQHFSAKLVFNPLFRVNLLNLSIDLIELECINLRLNLLTRHLLVRYSSNNLKFGPCEVLHVNLSETKQFENLDHGLFVSDDPVVGQVDCQEVWASASYSAQF